MRTFKAGSQFGISDGLIMTTGKADTMDGPNVGGIVSVKIPASDTVAGTSIGRQLLNEVLRSGNSTLIKGTTNVATIKMDLIPIGDLLKFNYIFASEEYQTFVCSLFNDVFGFFVKGPGVVGDSIFNGTSMEGYQNIAKIPGTINTLNNGFPGSSGTVSNCTFSPEGIAAFVDNSQPNNPLYQTLKFNGLSRKLTAKVATIPCTTNTLVLAIADVQDEIYDSGVFLESRSIVSGDYCTFAPFAFNGFNGNAIPKSPLVITLPGTNANFSVTATSTNGCSKTYSKAGILTSQEDLMEHSDFRLFPNPNQGQLFFAGSKIPKTVFAFDLTGRKTELKVDPSQSSISLNQLSDGLYFISVRFDGKEKPQHFKIQLDR